MNRYLLTAIIISLPFINHARITNSTPDSNAHKNDLSFGGGISVNTMPVKWTFSDHKIGINYVGYFKYLHELKNNVQVGGGIDAVQIGFKWPIEYTNIMGEPIGSAKSHFLFANPAISIYGQVNKIIRDSRKMSFGYGANLGYTMGLKTNHQTEKTQGTQSNSSGIMLGAVFFSNYALSKKWAIKAELSPRYYWLKLTDERIRNSSMANISCFAFPLTVGLSCRL